MVAVLIHPSGVGNRVGAMNWRKTIEQPVDYTSDPVAATLTSAERRTLERLHPAGRAAVWGAHGYHAARMAEVSPGDVAIFTGRKKVLAVGRIGLLTDNSALGDVLWDPHPGHGSYRFVYSLAPIAFTEMSQVDFRARGGFSDVDDFRQLRVLVGDHADALMAEFSEVIPEPSAVEREDWDGHVFGSAASPLRVADASRTGPVDVEIGDAAESERSATDAADGTPGESAIEARSTWDAIGRELLTGATTEAELLARLRGFVGSTDAAGAVRALRREQSLLREHLGIGPSRGDAPVQCGLCGRYFPRTLLVAAHVKPRSQCSEEERLDMPHVGMAACLLGCDALYEAGLVTVGPNGRILVAVSPGRRTHLDEHREHRFLRVVRGARSRGCDVDPGVVDGSGRCGL